MTNSNTNPERAREALGPLWRKVGAVHDQAMREDWSPSRYREAMTAAFAASERPERETGEVTKADHRAFQDASEAFAQHMGDPDGNDDVSAANDAAAEVIARHRLATPLPSGGDQSQEARVGELEAALLAANEAQRLTDEEVEMVERACAEGWADDPTGSSHLRSAERRSNDAWERAAQLRYAIFPLHPALSVQSEEGHG